MGPHVMVSPQASRISVPAVVSSQYKLSVLVSTCYMIISNLMARDVTSSVLLAQFNLHNLKLHNA